MTICKLCQHFINGGPIWYDQYCGATKKPLTVNPVTGEHAYQSINGLGTVYYDHNPYQYARDINTGDCPLYKECEP
jgi:hypothetical protein